MLDWSLHLVQEIQYQPFNQILFKYFLVIELLKLRKLHLDKFANFLHLASIIDFSSNFNLYNLSLNSWEYLNHWT